MTTMATPGSLRSVMDQLVALGHQVNETQGLAQAQQLLVLRWRPAAAPARFPALWHWMTNNPDPELRDQNRVRDFLTISAFVGIRHTDADKDLDRVETIADAYRAVVDPALMRPRTGPSPGLLGGTATWARRAGMRLVAQAFAGIEVLAIEFPLEIQVDRNLT